MSRGRKAHSDPPVGWFVSIPGTLAAKVELLLFDPATAKPKYGGRSGLMQMLLREWVEKQQHVEESPPEA